MPRAGLGPSAVVDAAAELADAGGLGALTLTAVAERLGVRTPSLYAHVDGLPDLEQRLGGRGSAALTERLQRAAAGLAGFDALRAVAHAYRQFAHEHPGLYAALQRAPRDPSEDQAQAAAVLVEILMSTLSGYEVPEAELVHAVRAVRAGLHGFISLERDGGFGLPLSVDESYEGLVALLDRGLRDLGSEPRAGGRR